jgi:hypothetical protein
VTLPSDDRGQSNVIGAILLVGLLMIATASVLNATVPDQGMEAENDHRETVLTDMIELRNQMLNTLNGDSRRAVTVRLGIDYPPLVSQFGSTTASERIGFRDIGQARVVDDTGTEVASPTTGIVEYVAEYPYIDREPIIVESSVVHSAGVARTQQQLVRGRTIRVFEMQGDINLGTSRPVPIEVVPGSTSEEFHDLDRLEVPTELSEDEWESLLSDQSVVQDVTKSGDTVTIDLVDQEYRVLVGLVGVNDDPPSGERIESEERDSLNPQQIGGMSLSDTSFSGSTVTLTFSNPSGTTEIARMRGNFYKSVGGGPGGASEFDVSSGGTTRATNVEFGGDAKDISPRISVSGDQDVELDLSSSFNQQQDFMVITVTIGDGQRAQYIVG